MQLGMKNMLAAGAMIPPKPGHPPATPPAAAKGVMCLDTKAEWDACLAESSASGKVVIVGERLGGLRAGSCPVAHPCARDYP